MATVRRATRDEAETVADLYVRARHAAVPAVPPMRHPDGARAWMAGVVRSGEEVWVGDDGGDLVAVMLLRDDWIHQLYVDPTRTGQGLGTQLLDVAKASRPQGLQLWVFQSNPRAHRFYERHGFVAVEWTDGSGNMEGSPDVRFVWRPGTPA